MAVLVGVDVGTSGTRALAVTAEGELVAEATRPHELLTPRPGWTEQQPADAKDTPEPRLGANFKADDPQLKGGAVVRGIPEPKRLTTPVSAPPEPPIRSSLDSASLAMIANAGGGQYFELDREGDREIANTIIDASRRRAGSRGLQEEAEELYWRCLVAAAAVLAVGVLFLQERVELWLQTAVAGAALAVVWVLTR